MRLSRRRCGRLIGSVTTFVVFVVSMVLCSYITAELQLNHFKQEIKTMCAPLPSNTTHIRQTDGQAYGGQSDGQGIPQQPGQLSASLSESNGAAGELEPCTLLAGNKRTHKGFLTIGIPSMVRDGDHSYLFTTLDSIVDNTSDEEKTSVVVVLLLADTDPEQRAQTLGAIMTKYSQHLTSGFLLVVAPPANAYPSSTELPANFNDSPERVKWRSKQAVDFAYLFSYCRSISQYFLSLDDDIVAKSDFVLAIRTYIEEQQERWVMLEFSTLGTIGKLYKSRDLGNLAKFVMLFYDQQPMDFLQVYYRLLHAQMKAKVRMPTLFQHVGVESTMENKTQTLSDNLFDKTPDNLFDKTPDNLFDKTPVQQQQTKGDNPAATIMTTMPNYLDNMPEYPYQVHDDRFFWTSRPPSKGDYYMVVFREPVTLERVTVHTGTESHPSDMLLSGNLEISEETKPPWNAIEPCTAFVVVAPFVNGQVDVSGMSSTFPISAKCLRILVTGTQDPWLIIRDVSVFVSQTVTMVTEGVASVSVSP